MRYLIVKTSAFGDIIHTYPVLQYLHRKFPTASVDWIVEERFSELVTTHPLVQNVFTVRTKAWRQNPFQKEHMREMRAFRRSLRVNRYDALFDLQGNTKSGFISAQARAKDKVGFGWAAAPEKPNVLFTNRRFNPLPGRNIREDYLFLVQHYFGDTLHYADSSIQLTLSPDKQHQVEEALSGAALQQGPQVMVCPGSAWKNKQLASSTLKEFLKYLEDAHQVSFLFIWGSPEEKRVSEELAHSFPRRGTLAPSLSLPALQNVMERVDLIVAMDSLPLHLAATTSTPTFSVFGASSSEKYRPIGEKHHAFQGSCPYGRTFEKRCPILRTCETGACIQELSSSKLINYFKSINLFK